MCSQDKEPKGDVYLPFLFGVVEFLLIPDNLPRKIEQIQTKKEVKDGMILQTGKT